MQEFGAERVVLYYKPIEGELNIVGLKEIVEAIPDETDRLRGEEIIEALRLGQTDLEDVREYKTEELEPDLQSLLNELTFME